ncbi:MULTISPECIES: hypothetical protein [unclassified Streptomyces]|uniref:hypothetical protein n=1 Tax=unclassified Streptomyces TaxID=2593676 RepID=UPI0011B0E37F|nr:MULTISPECIES: hypothetical protein [unclassified Streptomyces]
MSTGSEGRAEPESDGQPPAPPGETTPTTDELLAVSAVLNREIDAHLDGLRPTAPSPHGAQRHECRCRRADGS